MKKLIQHFFWLLFLLQLKKNKNEEIVIDLKNQLPMIYTNMFIQLDEPKDLNTNAIIFSIGYVINHIFYNAFTNYRNYFNKEFNLYTYHYIVKQIYGVNLSDFYMFQNFL